MKKYIFATLLTVLTPAIASAGSCSGSVSGNGQGHLTGWSVSCTFLTW